MTEYLDISQMVEKLSAVDNVLILCHKNPDGDTIGCSTALRLALQKMGKNASVLCSDIIAPQYNIINPTVYHEEFTPSVVVAVDVASTQLLGENNNMLELARHIDFSIDHHAGNNGYADYTLVDSKAAATAEIMLEIITGLGVEITPHIADCLYIALSTDTGCFKFSNTTARTFATASKLVEAGANIEEINTLFFQTKSRRRVEAERFALRHLEYHFNGACALTYLTRDDIEQIGVDPAELEDLTSLPISIEGVKVGLTLRQRPEGSYRISVRTDKEVNACALASRLGGGGHSRAGGCEIEGDLENTKAAILSAVQAELEILYSNEIAQVEEE